MSIVIQLTINHDCNEDEANEIAGKAMTWIEDVGHDLRADHESISWTNVEEIQ